MDLREFAEKVLFTDCLEEKLTPPGAIEDEDEDPGSAIGTPGSPGRPADLVIRGRGERVPFPGNDARTLENDEQRAVLLHFMANHELLATELMALVLLKFPDAPKAFRRGVLRTLCEEQEHTRLYMAQMAGHGMRFGELPVNGFFWSAIAPMDSPLDYVSRLSLTFEQANLDYSRHYAGLFEDLQMPALRALFDRIYHDEIAHVGYGLKWFRRWKDPGESDWRAFRRTLSFPLSPGRAKGIGGFNAEGRRKAGLDESFIRELRVFHQSRGRTPDVFVFNPLAESEIAATLMGRPHHPDRAGAGLVRDLATAGLFLARRDDAVLLPEPPSAAFLESLQDAGFPVPEIEVLDAEGMLAPDSPLRERKIGGLRPWAWTPQADRMLDPLKPNLPKSGPRSGIAGWSPALAPLFSKSWSAGFLEDLLGAGGLHPDWLCSAGAAGETCPTPGSVEATLGRLFDAGFAGALVKAPFSVSGRKRLTVASPSLADDALNWVKSQIEAQGEVVVEPLLARALDFSAQYEMGQDGLRFLGFTGLINDRAGRFQASLSGGRQLIPGAPGALSRFLHGDGRHVRWLHELYRESIPALLAPRLRDAGFGGPLGIDAFVYKPADASPAAFRLKPVVEINPRHTMGRLTLELARQAAQASTCLFQILTRADLKRRGMNSFEDYALALRRACPIQLTSGENPRLREGSLPLNDPRSAGTFLAVLHAGRALQRLMAAL